MIRSAGIIAAGHGERLLGAFPDTIKPLVPVAGRPLIFWIVDGLLAAGAETIVLLRNSRGRDVETALSAGFPQARFEFLRQDTASSWESFRLVASRLSTLNERFLISTADAIVSPADARRFSKTAFAPFSDGRSPSGALALTRFVEDEKPLWADCDEAGKVAALGEAAAKKEFVTCGLYALDSRLRLPEAGRHARLRDFLGELCQKELLRGVELSQTVDLDRPDDFAAAEKLLAGFASGRDF